MAKTDWNKLYSEKPNAYRENGELVSEALALLTPNATVLELGAGQGRDAALIAKEGFNMLATDISQIAVNQIRTLARELGLSNLHAEVCDQRNAVTKNYDMILSIRSLHTLGKTEGPELVCKIQAHTNPGGINLLVALTTNGDFFKLPKGETYFYAEVGELENMYKDWEIITHKLEVTQATYKLKDGSPTSNESITLVARKPKTGL